jgi:hypothetical protein
MRTGTVPASNLEAALAAHAAGPHTARCSIARSSASVSTGFVKCRSNPAARALRWSSGWP